MTKQEVGLGGKVLEPAEGGFPVPVSEDNLLLIPAAHGGKGKDLRLTRINLEVDRQAAVDERTIRVIGLGSIHVVGLLFAISGS
ncbi:hypothetical protein [Sinorhizobium medicae]|uniref:hypothetical protein n=1 Tax=Sinorhizobium medicae TaxID=110321 RepID=UPI001F2CBDB8|nr:hypothetical protein [Sinorhizobium medicae]